jgi:hypothetical protein
MGMNAAEFVKLWNAAATLEDAAEATKQKKISATVRAYNLRKQGWKLKRFDAPKKKNGVKKHTPETPVAEAKAPASAVVEREIPVSRLTGVELAACIKEARRRTDDASVILKAFAD